MRKDVRCAHITLTVVLQGASPSKSPRMDGPEEQTRCRRRRYIKRSRILGHCVEIYIDEGLTAGSGGLAGILIVDSPGFEHIRTSVK